MIVIPPIEITDARLASSSAYEIAPAAHSMGTTYAAGADASVAGAAGLITVYRSLQAGNVGHDPASSPTWWKKFCETYQVYSASATYAAGDVVIDPVAHLVYRSIVGANVGQALTDTSKWLSLGATNQRAMFDLDRSVGTRQASPMVVRLTPGMRVDSLGLFGMVGAQVNVRILVASVEVFNKTRPLTGRVTRRWYEYFFGRFRQVPSLLMLGLPPYVNAEIIITVTGSNEVACGSCVLGTQLYLGETEMGPTSPGLNFSSIERDPTFGGSKLTRRRTVPKVTGRFFSKKAILPRVAQAREDLNAQPAVYSGLDDQVDDERFELMLILGVYKKFDIGLDYPDDIPTEFEVEEL